MTRTDEIMSEIDRLCDEEADKYFEQVGNGGFLDVMLRAAFKSGFIRAVTVMAKKSNA